MVTIDFASDLHMEINLSVEHDVQAQDDTGDILILNGDISCFRFFEPHRTDNEAKGMIKRFSDFIAKQPHEHILWIPGNHEYYRSSFYGKPEELRSVASAIDPRLQLLNDEVFPYKDVNIFCSTLWIDFDGNDDITKHAVSSMMNDFRIIFSDEEMRTPITADEIYTVHQDSMRLLKNAYANRGDQKFVVATHHGPSLQSHSDARYGDSIIKYGYLSEYADWIADTNILAWIHGHTHTNVEYRINDTLISSAMYGYLGHDRLVVDSNMDMGRIYV